jgi:CRP-like cAMP-binding protein
LVRMSQGDVLYQSGGKLMHVYFPTTAIVSIHYELENGGTSEIASVGNEGLVGISLFMGGSTTPSRAVVLRGGHGYRLRASRLMEEFYRKGPLLRLLLRYTQALMTQMAQIAVCNCHHSTEQRLCRWLLQTLDRTGPAELAITQDAMGAILGVRREGITEAAGHLQARGLIKYRRGHLVILDRLGLEAQACECYDVLRRESMRLLSGTDQGARIERVFHQRTGVGTRRLGYAERRSNREVPSAGTCDSQTSFQFP